MNASIIIFLIIYFIVVLLLIILFVKKGIPFMREILGKVQNIQDEQKKAELLKEKEKEKKLDSFKDTFNSAPISIDMYNIVTIKDSTLNLNAGKYKVWREGDMINLTACENEAIREAIKNDKIYNNNQLRYSIDINKISLFERENTEQVVTNTQQDRGSHISLWTGNEKIDRIYTTEHTVGNKWTLIYIKNNPVDIKIMFDYEDYSVLNWLINK